jgi:hypothetical protein
MKPSPDTNGKSFMWAFALFLILFISAVLLGKIIPYVAMVLLAGAGFIPLLIQVSTGYALNHLWVATYSRKDRPLIYWVYFSLALLVAIWFSVVAYNVYIVQPNPSFERTR